MILTEIKPGRRPDTKKTNISLYVYKYKKNTKTGYAKRIKIIFPDCVGKTLKKERLKVFFGYKEQTIYFNLIQSDTEGYKLASIPGLRKIIGFRTTEQMRTTKLITGKKTTFNPEFEIKEGGVLLTIK